MPSTDAGRRPPAASLAAAFGVLLTAEVLFFGVMVLLPDARVDRVSLVIGVLVLGGAVGSLMVFQGVRGGWVLLVLTAVGALLALALMVLVLAALGATVQMRVALLFAVGPLGCLVLAPRRAVREWAGPVPTRRPAGGRRGPAGSH